MLAPGEYLLKPAPETAPAKPPAERPVQPIRPPAPAAEAEELPPPEDGGFKEFEPRRRAGKIATKLGLGWRKKK